MLEGFAGSEGKSRESQSFPLPLGLPRATRTPLTCGWRGCRTWQGNIPRGATTLSLPSAWCTLQPWWPSTWACWRTGNTSLWAVWHSRWALSSLRGFWGLLMRYKVSLCAGCSGLCSQTVLTVCCMNEMLLCENRNVYFIYMLCKIRYILYIYTLQNQKYFISRHCKNRNVLHIYSTKTGSYILYIYSTKMESYILYIYLCSLKIESHLYRNARIWQQISCLSKHWKCWVLFKLSKCVSILSISPEHIFQCFGRVCSFWWCCVPGWRRNLFWEVFYRSWSGGIAGTGCSIFLHGRRL